MIKKHMSYSVFDAIKNNNITWFKISHYDLYETNSYGSTPLSYASLLGKKNIVVKIIEDAIDCMSKKEFLELLNYKDGSGSTALCDAAMYDHGDVVCILLKMGANPNIFNKRHNYPLSYACMRGNENIVKQLLDYGAYIDYECLEIVVQRGASVIVKELLMRGADPSGNRKLAYTSIRKGYLEITKDLLSHGAGCIYSRYYNLDMFALLSSWENTTRSLKYYMIRYIRINYVPIDNKLLLRYNGFDKETGS